MIGQIIGSVISLLLGAGMLTLASVKHKRKELAKTKFNFWLILSLILMANGLFWLLNSF